MDIVKYLQPLKSSPSTYHKNRLFKLSIGDILGETTCTIGHNLSQKNDCLVFNMPDKQLFRLILNNRHLFRLYDIPHELSAMWKNPIAAIVMLMPFDKRINRENCLSFVPPYYFCVKKEHFSDKLLDHVDHFIY